MDLHKRHSPPVLALGVVATKLRDFVSDLFGKKNDRPFSFIDLPDVDAKLSSALVWPITNSSKFFKVGYKVDGPSFTSQASRILIQQAG